MEGYLTLPKGRAWEIENNYDSTDFFRALKQLLEEDLVLYLESTTIDDSLYNELSKYASDKTEVINPGTTWPKSKRLYLSLSSELINKLIEISENHAAPEYADHVVIYGKEIVLEAYDFTAGSIHMNGKLGEQIVQDFTTALNCQYKLINDE